MIQKIILSPDDYKLLVDYIVRIPVNFMQAEEAVKIKFILQSAKIIEVNEEDLKEKKDDVVSTTSN